MNPLRWLWIYKKPLTVLLVPVILLPLPLHIGTPQAKCGYVMITMAIYWMTEVLPLAVTSLLPVVMLPLLGVLRASAVAGNFVKDISLVLVGSLALAAAIEKCNLHRRMALLVLRVVGAKPQWLMAGFMASTWFLSMWLCNAATTTIMLPIVEAVVRELEGSVADTDSSEVKVQMTPVSTENVAFTDDDQSGKSNGVVSKMSPDEEQVQVIKFKGSTDSTVMNMESCNSSISIRETTERRKESGGLRRICKAFTLCVCYAANAGGTATLTGAAPNLVFKGQVDALWASRGLPSPINFSNWMVFALPGSFIIAVLTYVWLLLVFFGPRKMFHCCKKGDPDKEAAIKKVIRDQYNRLGPVRFEEVAVIVFFVLLVLLWFFREPGFMPGWSRVFPAGFTSDAVPAVFIIVMLHIFPSRWPWKLGNDKNPRAPAPPLLNWKYFQSKMPWTIILLLGGGFALANAAMVSGLSKWIASQLTFVRHLPGFVMVFLLCFLVALLTEVTSNPAAANIVLPIMASLAETIGKNPLYLMLPVAISTSFAYMLPSGSPPNAITFSFGRVVVFDMVKAGAFLNVIAVFVVTVATHTWGMAMFDFNRLPWSNTANTTMAPMEMTTVM